MKTAVAQPVTKAIMRFAVRAPFARRCATTAITCTELGRPVSFGGGAFSFGEMLHVANSPKVEVMTVSQAGSDAQAMSHFGLTQA